MAEIALVRFVEARIAFLDANVSVGTDVGSQTFEKLSGDASKTILAKLIHMKGIAIDACTELIERVGKSVMLDSDKSSVIEAVRGKVDQEVVEVDARFFDARKTQTQRHMFFEFYLVKSDWDNLANADASIELKIITLANRALAIGLVFPSEQTAASIVGIAMACSGRGGPDCLRWVREFKSVLRSLARVEKGSATALRPMEYAQDVNEFKEKYPDWYALSYKSEPPVDAPRIDGIVLQSVRGGVPCRSTRAGTMIGPSQRYQVKLQQQLMKALCPCAHRQQQDHCANHEIPGLKILALRKRQRIRRPLLPTQRVPTPTKPASLMRSRFLTNALAQTIVWLPRLRPTARFPLQPAASSGRPRLHQRRHSGAAKNTPMVVSLRPLLKLATQMLQALLTRWLRGCKSKSMENKQPWRRMLEWRWGRRARGKMSRLTSALPSKRRSRTRRPRL